MKYKLTAKQRAYRRKQKKRLYANPEYAARQNALRVEQNRRCYAKRKLEQLKLAAERNGL